MNVQDLSFLCHELRIHEPYEVMLRGYFNVDVNAMNYEAINNFICAMALYVG